MTTTRPPGSDRAILALAWLAAFLPMLDTSIVNLSLPQLGADFGASTSELAWIVGAYLLPVAVAMLAVGRLGDAFGHRRVLAGGGILFAAGAVVATLAPGLVVLLGGRVLQGLGASALLTLSMAVVTRTFSGAHRARALGIYLSGPAFGGAVGPILGGLLTGVSSWRLIFAVQVPPTVAIVVLTLVLLRPRTGRRPGFDLAGLALATLALAGVNVALLQANSWGWTSPRIVAAWLVALGAVAALVGHERRAAAPALRLEIFRDRQFVMSAVAGAAVWFGITSGFVLLPIYLERGRGLEPVQTALLIASWPLAALAIYPFASRITGRFGPNRVLVRSLAVATAAGLALALLSAGTSPMVIPLIGLALGTTTALLQVASASGAIAGFAAADAGMASAVFNSIRQVGSSLGGALPAAVYDLTVHGSAGRGAVLAGTQASFAARGAVILLATLVIGRMSASATLRRGSVVARQTAVEEESPVR